MWGLHASTLSWGCVSVKGHLPAPGTAATTVHQYGNPKRVKIGGKGTLSTRPVMPNDRTLPVLTASSAMCRFCCGSRR